MTRSTRAALRRRSTSLAGDSMMIVIGVYGRIDWAISRLARARHPLLPAGDAYLRFMEEREAADLGALASTSSRHEVKRRKIRDTLTGEICWALAFHRRWKTAAPRPLELLRLGRSRASDVSVRFDMLPAIELHVQVFGLPELLETTDGRKAMAEQLLEARRALAARVVEARR
jgi:hypothetical protein